MTSTTRDGLFDHERGSWRRLGDAAEVVETYYAISVERRLTHPAVRAISEAAPIAGTARAVERPSA